MWEEGHISLILRLSLQFFKGSVAFTVNKSHWTDIGGTNPGSVSTISTEIYQEGLHFPFVKSKQENLIMEF
jgi:N-methylhydantoinase B